MPVFNYLATDAQGNQREGRIDAVNRVAALARLKELRLAPTQLEVAAARAPVRPAAPARPGGIPLAAVRPGRAKSSGLNLNLNIRLPRWLGGGVKKKQLMVLTRQLATLMDAGVNLVRSLQILEKQEKSATLKQTLKELCEAVESGSTFADALAQHPGIFDKLFVNMVRAGEIGGVLEVTLNRLAEFIEKAEKIKTTVRGAMVYPTIVLLTAIGIMSFLMIKIIPAFTEIFESLLKDAKLPAITQFVVNVSNMFVERTPMVAGFLVLFVILVKLLGRTRPGRHYLDLLMLKLPVIGNLVSKVCISRFTRTFATLQTSGVPTLQALTIVRDTSTNEVMSRAIQSVHDSVKEGESISKPMEDSGVFPTMVVSMVLVGEETGRQPEMMVKVADNYDLEVDAAVSGLTSMIEPVLIIFLAVVVGTIVIAMFMPLLDIIQKLQ